MTIEELVELSNSRVWVNSSYLGISGFYDELSEKEQDDVNWLMILGIYADNDTDYDSDPYIYVYC